MAFRETISEATALSEDVSFASCLAMIDFTVTMQLPSDSTSGSDSESSRSGLSSVSSQALATSSNPLQSVVLGVHTGPRDDEMHLPSSSSESEDGAGVTRNLQMPFELHSGWSPGVNSGFWIHGRWAPLMQQGQVLLTNVVLGFRSLSVGLCRQMFASRCPSRKARAAYADEVAASFLGMHVETVRSIFEKLQRNLWIPHAVPKPCPKRLLCRKRTVNGDMRDKPGAQATDEQAEADRRSRNLCALCILVREALACVAASATDVSFICNLARLELAGVEVGTKYKSKEFLLLVEEIACNMVRACTLDALSSFLPGLLIPSDFSLVFDSVSIGTAQFSTKETLQMIHVRASNSTSGSLKSRLVAAPSQGDSHTGPHTKDVVLSALRTCPQGGLPQSRLRSSLVTVGGDGAMAEGGPDRKHSSTRACSLLYEEVFPDLPFDLTWWDLFHRGEVGGSWALRSSASALEIFDIAQVMVQLFGVGSGRVILRGVAVVVSSLQETEDDLRVIQERRAAQGKAPLQQDRAREIKPASSQSTRPIAYGFRVTESLYRNYTFYFNGLGARLEYTRGRTADHTRHGGQSVKKLVGVGNRLACLDFVVFLILHRDLCANVLRPFSQASQNDSMEAVEIFAATKKFIQSLIQEEEFLETFRFALWLTVILRTWLSDADLRRFWFVLLYTPAGKAHGTFVRHIFDILCEKRFKGCQLQWAMTPMATDPDRFRLVHPSCTCAAMPHRPRPKVACAGFFVLKGREINVPAWVLRPLVELESQVLAPTTGPSTTSSSSAPSSLAPTTGPCDAAASSSSSLSAPGSVAQAPRTIYAGHRVGPNLYGKLFSEAPRRGFVDCVKNLSKELKVLPRCEYQRKGPTPSHLQDVSRYRSAHCVLPLSFGPCYLEVLDVLDAYASFMRSMVEQLEGYFGSVGSSDVMRSLMENVSIFWNWRHLLHNRPTAYEFKALCKAYEILRPTLRHTRWPPRDSFPHVVRSWPDEKELGYQYALLCWRVRREVLERGGYERFMPIKQVRVQRLPRPSRWMTLFLRRLLGTRSVGSMRVVILVELFLGSSSAFEPKSGHRGDIWWTHLDSLCLPGRAKRWHSARYGRRQRWKFRGGLGAIASVAHGPFARSLVIVLEEDRVLDVGVLAADFDMRPFWHMPCGAKYKHGCYHIVRLGHRLRFLCPPETPAEGSGSIIHLIHRQMAQPNFQRIRHRLFIKEAGVKCLGHVRDESIVAAIAEALMHAGKKPFVRRHADGESHSIKTLRSSMLGLCWQLSADVAEEFLEEYRRDAHADPADLDPVVAETLRVRCERNFSGREFVRDTAGYKKTQGLPLFGNETRHAAATRSVWRARLLDWLQSDDGKAWAAKRDSRLDADDLEDCV